ncbi:hypothetical protein KP509_22G025100 [Ceratopteris richardii]|uniref:Origin recognition complex subunit 3 N-terminal domain-containing protein n=1 Tax=Ceratopteris richardii TaxID=49495 RepID=A0A8T2S6Q6_CERRI|nr:hypothetical protein KP509_22G025100 [Ceratopteris richardii]KAH7306685.1 hypothetical protein KP509_22G025100 [Ceratopteris richardii]
MLDDRGMDVSSDEEHTLSNNGDASQACFILHKFTKKSSSAVEVSPREPALSVKRKRGGKQDISLSSLSPCSADEPEDCGVWRMEAFKCTWADIEANIKEVFEVLNTRIFKEVQKFIHDILFYDAQLELYLSPKNNSYPHVHGNERSSRRLHVALLCLRNIDSSDHTMTFFKLKTHLKKANYHVANLLPHNFLSKNGVGAPLRSMLKQIVGINPETTDMDILASWYRAESDAKSPIVIIIEDAELCNSKVLAEFVIILSEWIAELPLILVMGMATSGEAIRKLLPGSTTRHLHMHNFMFPSPDEYLEGIIKGVILRPFPLFTVGHDVLRFLLSQYDKYDSTVTSFIRALKMACMEHFMSQPLSFLCTISLDSPLENVDYLWRSVSVLPSMQSKQYQSDRDVDKGTVMALSQYKEQKEKWSSTVNCILAAGNLVCMDPVKVFAEILERQAGGIFLNDANSSLNSDILCNELNGKTCLIPALLKRLRDSSEFTVNKILMKWIELTEYIPEWKTEAQQILNNLASESSLINTTEFISDGCTGSTRTRQLATGINSIEDERQESIVSNGGSSEMNVSNLKDGQMRIHGDAEPLNATRLYGTPSMQKKIGVRMHGRLSASLLEQMMRKYLIPFEKLPLNEALCFQNVSSIKEVPSGAAEW